MRAMRQTALTIALGGLSTLFAVFPSYAGGDGGDGIDNIVLERRAIVRGAGGGGIDGWRNGAGTLVPKGDGAYRIVYGAGATGHAGRDGVILLGGGTADDGPSSGLGPAATTMALAAR